MQVFHNNEAHVLELKSCLELDVAFCILKLLKQLYLILNMLFLFWRSYKQNIDAFNRVNLLVYFVLAEKNFSERTPPYRF